MVTFNFPSRDQQDASVFVSFFTSFHHPPPCEKDFLNARVLEDFAHAPHLEEETQMNKA